MTIATLPTALVREVAAEHGLVETATLVLFVAAAVLSALAARRRFWGSGYLAAAIFAAAAMRELDFHKQFTGRSITRGAGIGFIASPVVPLIEKVIVVLVGIALSAVVVVFFRREWARFRLGLGARARPVMLTLVGLAQLVVARVVDDTYARVKVLGMAVAARWQLLEELLELQAAAIFVIALLPALLASRARASGRVMQRLF
ncbi:MAG: hypothetical protein ACREJV_12265 [Candidatus Rokuibacteriota bacterium]